MLLQKKLTKKEILAAIKKSGYLFESEISKKLSNKGYFIENSPSFFDEETNVSREIDMVVESYIYKDDDITVSKCYENNIFVGSSFVIELKNNDFPLVLITEEEFSPNNSNWDALKIVSGVPSSNEGLTAHSDITFDNYEGFYEELLGKISEEKIFTQYCSFKIKKNKGEIFAVHPNNLHSSLMKISRYCDKKANDGNKILTDYPDRKESCIRHNIYLPILLIKDNLFELTINKNNSQSLKKNQFGILKQNYHIQGEPCSTLVFVVTEKGLSPFLDKVRTAEDNIRKKILKLKNISIS